MNDDSIVTPAQAQRWLLLIHQIPPKPDYFRVKVSRRLRRIGARALKNSVYVLPSSDEALEDFQWLVREIVAEGGEATLCEAEFLAGITNQEVHAMFAGPQEPDIAGAPLPATITPGRTWVTRRGVKVDRMASAWLIRRFIDPAAHFKFVPPRGYAPVAGELRFDMFDAEYGHEADHCTFETLCERFQLREPALRAIGEIVHDIDVKDDKYGRAETAGVALVVDGIASVPGDDAARLERGAVVFDGLLAHFQGSA